MLVSVAVAALALVIMILLRSWGPKFGLTAILLFSFCLFPFALTASPLIQHVGIGGPVPEVRTFTVAVGAGFLLGVLGRGATARAFLFAPFAIWLILAANQWWPASDVVLAGLLQLLTGVVAWGCGSMVGASITDERFSHGLTLLLAGIVAIQVIVCVLQFAGVPINGLSPTESEILGGRVNGTANHPNNLGKMLLLLLFLLLPLTEQANRRAARLALGSAMAMLLPLGLAQGRANFAAVVAALILWSLLTPTGRQAGMKLLFLGGGCVAVLLSAAIFLARFDEDPTGGVRPQIYAIAVHAVPNHLFEGVGPNNYVTEIASREGSYIPVHNTFVLLLAETGAMGALLLLAPLLLVLVRAARSSGTNPHARAIVSVSPGLGVVGWTGWGLLGTSILPLMMFSVGFAFEALRRNELGAGTGQRETKSVTVAAGTRTSG